MSSKIKFVFLGATHPHTRGHMRTLELMDEVASVIVWDERREALEKLREGRGEKIEHVTTDLAEAPGGGGAVRGRSGPAPPESSTP